MKKDKKNARKKFDISKLGLDDLMQEGYELFSRGNELMDYANEEKALTSVQKSRMLRSSCDMLKMADDIKAEVMFKIIKAYPELKSYHGVHLTRDDNKKASFAIGIKTENEADEMISEKKEEVKSELTQSAGKDLPIDEHAIPEDIMEKIMCGNEEVRETLIKELISCAMNDSKRPKEMNEKHIRQYANMYIDKCIEKKMQKMAKA